MKGRKIDYTPEIAEEVCTRIADGESLRTICKDKRMPSKGLILKWLFSGDYKEFEDRYILARQMQAEKYAEEIVEVADDATNDWMESQDPDNPGYKLNGEHINRSRLRIDARKWVASKLLPKKYGDRVTTELIGDKEKPVQLNVTMTPEEAYKKLLNGN